MRLTWMLLCLVNLKFCSLFEVPEARIEAFRPRGLRISIPDQEGIKLFAIHAKINEEMNGREGGTLSRDITKAKNGYWTFYDPNVEIKVGDVLYYWTYVDYFDGKNKLGYTNDDESFVIQTLLDKPSKAPPVTLTSGCKASATTINNQMVCTNELIFNENFESFQTSNWANEIKFGGKPDYEFVLYTNRPEIITVASDHLRIKPALSDVVFGRKFLQGELDLGNNCTGVQDTLDCHQTANAYLILPPIISAQITTKNKFSFKYGKIEIRAKFPKGDWLYPQLFLNPTNPDYAPAQIRVGFAPGNDGLGAVLQAGGVLGSSRGGQSFAMRSMRKTEGLWVDGFNKYTLLWKPDQITVSVNDMVYGTVVAPEGGFVREAGNLNLGNVIGWNSAFAPFDKEMYLSIGVGVGGHIFEDRHDGSKPWKNREPKEQKKFYKARSHWLPTWSDDSTLQVDYIKIWAL